MSPAPADTGKTGRPTPSGGSNTPESEGREQQAAAGSAEAGAVGAHSTEVEDERRIPGVSVPRRQPVSTKGVLALLMLAGSLVAVAGMAIHRFSSGFAKPTDEDHRTGRDRPAAASAEPRRLDLSGATAQGSRSAAQARDASASGAPVPAGTAQVLRIPALEATPEELAEPIGVRRTGAPAQAGAGAKASLPEDAPVMIVSSRTGHAPAATAAARGTGPALGARQGQRDGETPAEPAEHLNPLHATERNLQDYQRRLQVLLDQLTQAGEVARAPSSGVTSSAHAAPSASFTASSPPMPHALAFTAGVGFPLPAETPPADAPPPYAQPVHPAPATALLGGQLPGSTTPKAMATMLGNRSLTLAKGTSFTCALKSRVVTASSGMVGCMVQRHVYSDDGRVLLIERGSHLDGEYRLTTVRPGTVRIPVLWSRVRTPLGVIVNIDSPATGQLGESGIDGHVDNRWMERLGAAMLLSVIDDSVQLIASKQAESHPSGTVVLSSATSSTSKLAEKVLDSTISIPPLIYRNQGGIVSIYVARDVDFSGVYELQVSTP